MPLLFQLLLLLQLLFFHKEWLFDADSITPSKKKHWKIAENYRALELYCIELIVERNAKTDDQWVSQNKIVYGWVRLSPYEYVGPLHLFVML